MASAQKVPSRMLVRGRRIIRRRLLPIGPRLIVAFAVVILLTGVIGVLAVQQFSALTAATNELNTRDLPEVIAVERLRTALFQQRSLEQRLVSSDETNVAADLATLSTTLNQVSTQYSALLAFEPPDAPGTTPNDTALMQQFADGIARSNALSKQIQSLVSNGRVSEAQAIQQSQQAPLLQSLLDATVQMRTLEQGEVSVAAEQAQQQSSGATWTVLALTLFSIPLSILLAVSITRSLTKPLSTLLHATEAIASGDLEVEPQIARGDELGQLATAFNSMRLKLRSTIDTLALQRQETQAIIDASADGVMLVDAQRKILQVNPAVERLSGWSKTDALGKHCWEILGCRGETVDEAAEHERVCPIKHALETGSEQSIEMHASSRNGGRRWFSVSCAPLTHDAGVMPSRLVVGIHDISHLKEVEQLKSDFVAMVSHELRAPLSTVSGSVETLGILDPAADREAYHEVVHLLQQQTLRLRQVIEEVLQLTRVDAGRLQVHLQPLPLNEFLKTALDNTRLAWIGEDRPLSLKMPQELPLVWGDHDLLEIVMRNLLDNARKYSPAGSPIEIEVEAVKSAAQIQVRVSDRGSGIPSDQLQHIFERFSRGANSSRDWTRGYGLGLYIARELLRAHNGEIRAENRKDGGACFIFSLRAVVADPRKESD